MKVFDGQKTLTMNDIDFYKQYVDSQNGMLFKRNEETGEYEPVLEDYIRVDRMFKVREKATNKVLYVPKHILNEMYTVDEWTYIADFGTCLIV